MNHKYFMIHHKFPIVGKIRKQWIKDSLSPIGIEVLQAVKQKLDPQNIFGANNILPGK